MSHRQNCDIKGKKRNVTLAGLEKHTHILSVPASALHWGRTDLKLPPEHDSKGSQYNIAFLELILIFPYSRPCMQLTFKYFG